MKTGLMVELESELKLEIEAGLKSEMGTGGGN